MIKSIINRLKELLFDKPQKERPVKWSAEEVATLNKMMNDGLTDLEIAVAIGRTESAVYQKRRKIQLGGI